MTTSVKQPSFYWNIETATQTNHNFIAEVYSVITINYFPLSVLRLSIQSADIEINHFQTDSLDCKWSWS